MSRRWLCFIFSCTAALAGPWEDFLQARHKGESAGSAWTLCLPSNLLAPGDLLEDRPYQKLSTAGDWRVQVLSPAQAQDLHQALGADWALLSPAGSVAGVGQGQPHGPDLLDAIHASGAKARFEVREAFLKEHPDHGEARQEALSQELRMLRARVTALKEKGKVKVPAWQGPGATGYGRASLAGAEGDAQAEALYAATLEALRALSQTTHWTREAQWVASRLSQFDLAQAATGKRLFADLAPEAETAAAADPQDTGLLQLWMELQDGAGTLSESLSGTMTAVPGTVWPTAAALPSLLEPWQRRRDWAGLQRLLNGLVPQAPPEPLTPKGWDDYCDLRGALLANTAAVLAAQGGGAEARGALDEGLKWAGSRVVQGALMRRGLLDPQGDGAAVRELMTRTAGHAHAKPPMPPQPPPLRLTLMGRPPWLLAWTALRDAPDLALWSPGELGWDIAAPEVHAHARRRFGWDAAPRWVLFRGEEPLVSGEACPEPRALAGILAAHGTPMLERLARVLAQHPSHLAAHRARFELMLTRMPDARLEPLLVEDAAKARLSLPFGPGEAWKPDEALWSGAAQTVLPALEAELRSWPGATELWDAWIAWARFHPAHPSVVDLAKSLPFWNPNGDFRSGLPFPVQRAVAAELRRQGNYLLMRDWFQSAWDQLDHRAAADLRPWERQWLGERRKEEETAVFQPLRDALRALGMTEQQVDLERTFGAMMGREPARSR